MADGLRHPFDTPPEPGAAIEVAPGILWMRLPLPMALDHVNVYALDDGPGWTLVDAGMFSRKTVAIWEALLAGPLGGRPVNRLVVTHHHPDHIGMAGWFQARGAELVTTRTAWPYARMLVLDEQPLTSPQAMMLYRRAGLPQAELDRKAAERPFNFCDVVAPLPVGFARIADGDHLMAGGRRWRVRTGDGHAPEQATLWSLEDGLVIAGDQVLPGISPNIGVYPSEPEADPIAEWLESCARLAEGADDSQLVLPGHKLPFTGLPFRLAQMAENHHGALARLVDHLVQPRLAIDCFLPLFRREIGPAEQGLALAETLAHLNWLLRRGRVSRSLRPDGAWLWAAA